MFREPAIRIFPEAPGPPRDPEGHLAFVDDIHPSDACHSLSIEGYRVTPELTERVRAGHWNLGTNEADRQGRDAMAARGYWRALHFGVEVGPILS